MTETLDKIPAVPECLKTDQLLGHMHEMVVMDPYIIGIAAVFYCNLSEFTVDVEVLVPVPGPEITAGL